MKSYTILLSGKVQGVRFRKSAQEKALELGVKGSAKNLEDGAVLIEAEGPEAIVNKFLEWCAIGPAHAEVISTSIEESDPKNYRSFEITY